MHRICPEPVFRSILAMPTVYGEDCHGGVEVPVHKMAKEGLKQLDEFLFPKIKIHAIMDPDNIGRYKLDGVEGPWLIDIEASGLIGDNFNLDNPPQCICSHILKKYQFFIYHSAFPDYRMQVGASCMKNRYIDGCDLKEQWDAHLKDRPDIPDIDTFLNDSEIPNEQVPADMIGDYCAPRSRVIKPVEADAYERIEKRANLESHSRSSSMSLDDDDGGYDDEESEPDDVQTETKRDKIDRLGKNHILFGKYKNKNKKYEDVYSNDYRYRVWIKNEYEKGKCCPRIEHFAEYVLLRDEYEAHGDDVDDNDDENENERSFVVDDDHISYLDDSDDESHGPRLRRASGEESEPESDDDFSDNCSENRPADTKPKKRKRKVVSDSDDE